MGVWWKFWSQVQAYATQLKHVYLASTQGEALEIQMAKDGHKWDQQVAW